jgi:hypothetical protein
MRLHNSAAIIHHYRVVARSSKDQGVHRIGSTSFFVIACFPIAFPV